MSTSQENLVKQASMTADAYFYRAITTIDKQFGDGYAKNHPELIVGFMTTAASDFQSCLISQTLDERL